MSEYVNHDMQLAPLDDFDMQLASNTDFDSIDWSSLNEEEVMWEPWMDDIDWSECYGQGTDAVAPGAGSHQSKQVLFSCTSMVANPANRIGNTAQSHEPEYGDRNIAPRAHKRAFTCDSQGCKSKTFSSRTDLYRHQQVHITKPSYFCAAKDCFRGKNGFHRKDKLKDHMIAAHDNDTVFACPDNHYHIHICRGLPLTRDIMAIHVTTTDGALSNLNEYRDCPLPKCPYRMYLGRYGTSLDPLQAHLVTKHDAKGRQNFTSRIQERGYDAATGEIICPVCLGEAKFSDHSSFYHHFFAAHFRGPTIGIGALVEIPPFSKADSREFTSETLRLCTFVPDEVRQCRRTILSLWPNFENYPVWEDVQCL